MNKILVSVGILLIVSAFSAGLAKDLILSYLGVPSPSDIGKMVIDDMTLDKELKDPSYKAFESVKLLENLPLIIFIIGIILLVAGLLLPN